MPKPPNTETLSVPGVPSLHIRKASHIAVDRPVGLRLRMGTKDPRWEQEPVIDQNIDVRCECTTPGELAAGLRAVLERYPVDRRKVDLTSEVHLPEPAPMVTVIAEAHGFRNDQGMCIFALFDRAEGFPSRPITAAEGWERAIEKTGEQFVSNGTLGVYPPGTYAVSLLHDENGNRKLDTILGFPKEGFGFSNDPPVRTGPPRFDACRFLVTDASAVRRITIRVLYLAR